MARKERQASKGKKIHPKFWVFCEGKTEKAYVEHLRTKYRLPVKVIPLVVGANINEKLISSHLDQKEKHPKDQVFLLYDADVKKVLHRLKLIKNAKLLVSNPCTEFWFLLHYKNQSARISGMECIRQLNNRNRTVYRKGFIDDKLKKHLNENQRDACGRAVRTRLFENPSTNLYVFVDLLDKARQT
ncbi:MAG: RloB family protein [Bacteroidales bacterium]